MIWFDEFVGYPPCDIFMRSLKAKFKSILVNRTRKMVSFELGKEIEKGVFLLVPSSWQYVKHLYLNPFLLIISLFPILYSFTQTIISISYFNFSSIYHLLAYLLVQEKTKIVCRVLIAVVATHGRNAVQERVNKDARMDKIVADYFHWAHQFKKYTWKDALKTLIV